MGHLLGYARVSTTDQQSQLQVDALQDVGCYRVFTEMASGARSDRPILGQWVGPPSPWRATRRKHRPGSGENASA